MKNFKRIFAVLLSLLVIIGLFAACDKGKDDDLTTLGADESGDLNEAGGKTLIVGTNADFPPFESFDDDNNFVGFDMDLMREIGKKIGMEIKFENFDFDLLVAAIGTKFDLGIAAFTVDEDRAKSVDFSDPYFTAKQNVIVMNDSEITSADDLKGLRIGAQNGTTGADIAEDVEDVKFVGYEKAALAVLDLKNGNLDAVIVDRNPAAEFIKVNEDMKAIGEDFFEDEFYAIAVKKGEPELLEKINTALKELKEDGTYDKLVAKHIVESSK